MSETNPEVLVSPSDAVNAPAPESTPAPAAVPGILTPEPPAPAPTPVEEEIVVETLETDPVRIVEETDPPSTKETPIEYAGSVVGEEPVEVETVKESAPIEVVQAQPMTTELVEQVIEALKEKTPDADPQPEIVTAPSESVPVIVPVPEDKPIVVVAADAPTIASMPEASQMETLVAPADAELVQVNPPTIDRPVIVVKEEDVPSKVIVEDAVVKQTVAALAPQAMPAIVLTAPSEDHIKIEGKGRSTKEKGPVEHAAPIETLSVQTERPHRRFREHAHDLHLYLTSCRHERHQNHHSVAVEMKPRRRDRMRKHLLRRRIMNALLGRKHTRVVQPIIEDAAQRPRNREVYHARMDCHHKCASLGELDTVWHDKLPSRDQINRARGRGRRFVHYEGSPVNFHAEDTKHSRVRETVRGLERRAKIATAEIRSGERSLSRHMRTARDEGEFGAGSYPRRTRSASSGSTLRARYDKRDPSLNKQLGKRDRILVSVNDQPGNGQSVVKGDEIKPIMHGQGTVGEKKVVVGER